MARASFFVIATLWLATSASAQRLPPKGDVYTGMTLLLPDKERRIENAYVLVEDGRIVDFGAGPPPPRGARVHDMKGTFALPGFIDAHAHITAGPHQITVEAGKRRIGIASEDAKTQRQARIALAFGVTTVRNPGGDTEANARYDRMIASGAWTGPEALHAGSVIQPPPFGGPSFAYPRTEAEWDAEAARQARLGMHYFKLYTHLSEQELALGIEAAHRHGLKAIAHMDTVSWQRAAELGVDGLEHALPTSPDLLEPRARSRYLAESDTLKTSKYMYRWFEHADLEGPIMRKLIRTLARRRIATNMTFLVNEGVYNVDRIDQLYPAEMLRFEDPEALEAARKFQSIGSANWTPQDFARARAVMPKVLEFGRLLHDAGVPMMIGTDGHGGGFVYARELALHSKAGIPVWEVLRMATSKAAKILGLGKRTGRIACGYEGDIVFLSADPTVDLKNASAVRAVLNNGRLHSFAELTGEAP